MTKAVRTRFAPSPTGALHAGTVRTALFAWLTARQAGGQFLLRIEDTDKAREVKAGIDNIIESLKYLGLDWDEGPDVGGPYGPYIQSQRLGIYKEWGEKLLKAGRAYADPYTTQQVNQFRQAAQAAKKPFLYRDHRPARPPTWDGSQPLRFKSEPKTHRWRDAVMGQLQTGPEVVDDFILIKSDGYPTYNFAHIVDDHLMQISHVVRSQEFISSVPIFLNLYEALGIERPVLATVPLVLGIEGTRKLSKREGAKQLLGYRDMGILPEALMNVLATTGWNDGTNQEIFSKDELIKKFSLKRVQKSNARFDEQHLLWLNGHYVRGLKLNKLAKLAEAFWPPEAKGVDDEHKLKILALVQERLKYLAELPNLTHIFFSQPEIKVLQHQERDPQTQKEESLLPADKVEMINESLNELAKSDFSQEDLTARLNHLLDKLNTNPSILFEILRIAIAGGHHTPPLAATLSVLGKTESIQRIKKSISVD